MKEQLPSSHRVTLCSFCTSYTAFVLGFASAASISLSIAISQILLALSLVTLPLVNAWLDFPPIRLPPLLFFVATLTALLLSADPQGGTSQIRKFFLFGTTLVICSTFATSPGRGSDPHDRWESHRSPRCGSLPIPSITRTICRGARTSRISCDPVADRNCYMDVLAQPHTVSYPKLAMCCTERSP
jgi:hypothetical protein